MILPRSGFALFFLLLLMVCRLSAFSQAMPQKYDLSAFPEAVIGLIKNNSTNSLDSMLSNHSMLHQERVVISVLQPKEFIDLTADFYLLVVLVMLLGLIRLADPRYFQILWQAFKIPSLSKPFKEKLQSAKFPNLMMNLFFTVSVSAYAFYVIRNVATQHTERLSPSLLITILIPGIMIIYLAKYGVIRFTGWAFRVENITDQYLFNVFLVNKVLGILLVPFTIFLAFAENEWAKPALIISMIGILIFFISRYARSWQVLGSFFQYSKFHFFAYLCASELLPLAVLMKLLARGLIN